MTVTINHDVDYNTHPNGLNLEYAQQIVAAGGSIVYYQHMGPGGGNPQYGIQFPDRATAERYLRDVYGDDDSADHGGYDHYFTENDAFDFYKKRVAS